MKQEPMLEQAAIAAKKPMLKQEAISIQQEAIAESKPI